MTEPATTLTDMLLAVVGTGFFVHQRRSGAQGATVFFAALAMAAVCGALSHGFLKEAAPIVRQVVWWITLVCTGASAAGLALVGLECLEWGPARRRIMSVAVPFAVLAVWLWFDPRFRVGLRATAIGGLVLVAGLIHHARRRPGTGAGLVTAGLGLSVVAGLLQQRGVGLHPVHFDHNATYHVIMIPALLLIHAGALAITASRQG